MVRVKVRDQKKEGGRILEGVEGGGVLEWMGMRMEGSIRFLEGLLVFDFMVEGKLEVLMLVKVDKCKKICGLMEWMDK